MMNSFPERVCTFFFFYISHFSTVGTKVGIFSITDTATVFHSEYLPLLVHKGLSSRHYSVWPFGQGRNHT